MGELINIRGKNLYVEDEGKDHQKALLYLHGGPGASCFDFSMHQGKILSEEVRVITFDQRGVLRSQPIEEHEKLEVMDIILDCEAIRQHFNIPTWSIIGHSFGGYLALLYADIFPNSIEKVIYECPSFDFSLSLKSLFNGAKKQFEISNESELATRCGDYIAGTYTGDELLNAWIDIGVRKLGERRDILYIHGISPQSFNQYYEKMPISGSNGETHLKKLREEGKLYDSLIPLLANVKHPSLLIKGFFDLVCCELQLKSFENLTPQGTTKIFQNSSHFPRIEEPDKYTKEVINFIFS